jgi:outer membrane receptor for ferrienterochelin and colicins
MKWFLRFSLVPVFFIGLFYSSPLVAQNGTISGIITAGGKPLPFTSLTVNNKRSGAVADSVGKYRITALSAGTHSVAVSVLGYKQETKTIVLAENDNQVLDFDLKRADNELKEVVVTGTLKEVTRSESPVPVEIYTPAFFKKNPTPNIFEALQNINGVRPQLNCNVCNTGDIHINGLEGPYTMVLIDGMPIVSSLATVYGLSGIPNSLVERIEIVKGPASSLYGSEAVGGLINIITKRPENAPVFSADVFTTSWLEHNADISLKLNAGKKAVMLTGMNLFSYRNVMDKNNDRFTDITLQDRASLFQKWSFQRKDNRLFSVIGRYAYENRWGGETRWKPALRGSDSIYAESIYTRRFELIGNYQLPVKEKLLLSFSYNDHDHDSRYGVTSFIGRQRVAFAQTTWDKVIRRHDLLAGVALRYTHFDDNTPATSRIEGTKTINTPDITWLPGIFLQDEITLASNHKLLVGGRYDYNSRHGHIYTPRLAYKWSLSEWNAIRVNFGTGFRVVNLFTEDHAALTGARKVVIKEQLRPEKSFNVNLNYVNKFSWGDGNFLGFDASAWYTRFTNRIIADYETDPNLILYDNLQGHAISRGISTNFDVAFYNGLKIIAGATWQGVGTVENGVRQQQILTERWTGVWTFSYKINRLKTAVDYSGNIYGPMRLPLLGALDPRRQYSPVWSIQNIQFTFSGFNKFECYAGIKNLLNWTPNKGNPFIIARTNDPFDKRVQYDNNGQVMATPDNPYALTFDPNYVYAPNQGLRAFMGIRVRFQ